MRIKNIILTAVLLFTLGTLAACSEEAIVVASTYSLSATTDENVSITFYADEELNSEYEESDLAILDTGADVYLVLTYSEGYELDTLSTVYNLSEIEDDVYFLDSISGNTNISITSKEVEIELADNEYLVSFTFNSSVSVTVYDDESLSNPIENDSVIVTDEVNYVYFKVEIDEDYELYTITNSKDFDIIVIDETTFVYKLENVDENVEVTISSKLIVDYDDTSNVIVTLSDDSIDVTNNNGFVFVDGSTITIGGEGTYYFIGSISESNIIVDALDDEDVDLFLQNVSLTSSLYAPIYVNSADKVNLIIDGDVAITDNRTDDPETSTEPNSAIYSNVDLDVEGTGTLVVTANYYNGISSKDDLKLKELSLTVVAFNNAIKGNDSVTIKSGTYNLVATNGDGIKTENSHINDNGNQKGNVEIEGGSITINALQDGIDAAYDLVITGDPVITIYTNSYADLSGESTEVTSSTTYYLITPTTLSNTDQYVLLVDGEWIEFEYLQSFTSGRSMYYLYALDVSDNSLSYELYVFDSGETLSTSVYTAKSDVETFHTTNNSIYLDSSSISDSEVSTEWVFLELDDSSTSLAASAKALKADNEITIDSGTFTIYSVDDAVHANSDVLLDTGEYGLGNVTINGGTFLVESSDDAFHADNELTINGGEIIVTYAYEGLEGGHITINGGYIDLYVKDDAVNAAGVSSPSVTITGGSLYIETASNDPDSIDSNGSYTQTGGLVVAITPVTQSKMGGALDVDGTLSITGGTFIGLGMSHGVPTSSGNNISTGLVNLNLSPGEITILDDSGNTLFTFESEFYNTNYFILSSDQLEEGHSYYIYQDGELVYTINT